MQLFDFLRVLFEDPQSYKELNDYDKARQYFMLNRLMSVTYPLQANILNHIRIPQGKVVDYWQRNMRNIYTKVPSWIYVKGKKKAEATQNKAIKLPSKDAINKYLIALKLTHRDLDDAYKLYGDTVYDPIRRYEKVLDQ